MGRNRSFAQGFDSCREVHTLVHSGLEIFSAGHIPHRLDIQRRAESSFYLLSGGSWMYERIMGLGKDRLTHRQSNEGNEPEWNPTQSGASGSHGEESYYTVSLFSVGRYPLVPFGRFFSIMDVVAP